MFGLLRYLHHKGRMNAVETSPEIQVIAVAPGEDPSCFLGGKRC